MRTGGFQLKLEFQIPFLDRLTANQYENLRHESGHKTGKKRQTRHFKTGKTVIFTHASDYF